MNFKKAYEEMLKGKKVRRLGWKGYWFIEDDKIKIRLKDGNIKFNAFTQETITNTLADDWEVVKENKESKVWKPEKDGHYYYYDNDGRTYQSSYCEDSIDKCRLEFGNCFKTKEEAEHMIEKLKVINELKKFALENNEEEIDWKNSGEAKYLITYHYACKELEIAYYYYTQYIPFNIYFTSKEIAQKAIETIGEDRIKKYYFDIDEENSK